MYQFVFLILNFFMKKKLYTLEENPEGVSDSDFWDFSKGIVRGK